MSNKFYELMFTPAVKEVQTAKGSRATYARGETGSLRNAVLTDAEIDFIEQRDGFYLATVGAQGRPYMQFRGGRRGFLKVLDERTLGFADFRGNRQYISVGNLQSNAQVALFLMDYANQRRLKIQATAEIKEATETDELIEKLRDTDYQAKVERAVILHAEAFDWNCPQHITQRYTIDEIKIMVQPMNDHIEKLEKEIERLKELKK